ncbi:MAG TPA: hypothetical protein VIY56_17235 [Vicinamibacterales bacterium]
MRGMRPFSGTALVPGGLTTPRPGVDAFRAQPDTYRAPNRGWADRPGGDGRNKRRPHHSDGYPYPGGGGIYFPGYAYDPYGLYAGTTTSEAPTPYPPTGFLRLFVTPRRADVIVDGIYEGAVDDFGGTGERTLPSGVHRVRLETEGYEPVEFDVRIPDNDTITLRRDLYPLSAAPPPVAAALPAAPAQPPKTIYVIPRCYLGDTRPRQDQLPAGCSVADLRALP